jgi:hypothetical protein
MEHKEFTPESEKLVERRLVEEVAERGGLAVKMLPFQFAGLPDRLCLMPGGKVFFVELKSTGKNPSPIQQVAHERLRRLGFAVYVIDHTRHITTQIPELCL